MQVDLAVVRLSVALIWRAAKTKITLGREVFYRVTLVVEYLGWVDLDLGSSPRKVGRYCSYLLLPKQGGGTFQI